MAFSEQSMDGAADRALRAVVVFWWCVAAAGLWVFGLYIAAVYGVGVASGDLVRWNVVLPDGHGYVRGDAPGNTTLGVHLAAAFLVTASGLLQLVPRLRARAPAVHRWNGRLFLSAGMAAAVSGLLIALTRGAVAGDYMTAGNALNAALILLCGGMAWRRAVQRRIAEHRRWALRAFIVINAIWFYRLGMMFWFTVNRGPVGHTDAFDGPWDIFLAFAHVLVPLGVMELYLAARDRGGALARGLMAGGLLVATLAMGVGIAAAVAFMWLPRI
jgi:hypothetical protein